MQLGSVRSRPSTEGRPRVHTEADVRRQLVGQRFVAMACPRIVAGEIVNLAGIYRRRDGMKAQTASMNTRPPCSKSLIPAGFMVLGKRPSVALTWLSVASPGPPPTGGSGRPRRARRDYKAKANAAKR